MSKPQSWSIIVFAYNERKNLEPTVEKCLRVLEKLSPKKHEVLIVDDGSTDGTHKEVKKLELKHFQVRGIRHETNQGIGPALRTGYSNAKYENICAIPADGQFDPKELLPYPTIAENTILCFYRKEKPGYSKFREGLTQFHRVLNRVLLGTSLKDVNWVKAYKKNSLDSLNLKIKSSLIESEICSKLILQRHAVKEVQSTYHERVFGQSKGASYQTIARAAKETLKLATVINLFRFSQLRETS